MDIVFCDGDEWYFYDETWENVYGPYGSEYAAHKDLSRYCIVNLGGQCSYF